jgi:hypothetical protein
MSADKVFMETTIKRVFWVACLVGSFSAIGEGLKSTDMGNTSLGSGTGSLITPEQMRAMTNLQRNPSGGGSQPVARQPSISPEQMNEMMKMLQEYKVMLEKRNEAMKDLLKED